MLGILLTAVFYSSRFGGLAAPDYSISSQFVTQAIGVLATVVWCGLVSFVLLKILDAVIGLRVSVEQETEGLDLVCHDERGYNL